MAQSKSSGSSGKKKTRSSAASSRTSARSGKAGGAKSGGTRSQNTTHRASGRAQRRAQSNNLGHSVALAGFGLWVIALVLVRGEGVWLIMRNSLFGLFGIVTYLLGPFLLYLAYLVASGYRVGLFVAKMLLLSLTAAAVPVVFSKFAVHESTAWDIVQMLFNWGQTRFWAGGVFGGIGAVLLVLFGRPGANILMLLLFLMGLMIFFALTPADVVAFINNMMRRYQAEKEAERAERTAYDTQLFGQQPEEESIENLTGSLPGQPRPAQHPAFANDFCSLIDQKFRIVFQRGVVNGIWIEGLSIPQSRFIKCTTLRSIQEAHTQIFSGSCDNKMGTILSTDQAGGRLSLAAPEDDLHMEHRPVFICSNHAVSLLRPVPLFSLNPQTAQWRLCKL